MRLTPRNRGSAWWPRWLGLRLAQAIPVLLLASVLVFGVTRLSPGDPATVQLGMRLQRPGAEQALAALRNEMGLDKPIVAQYGIWLGHVARGNLGTSARYGSSVSSLIAQKFPITLELILAGIVPAVIAATLLGTAAAKRPGSPLDLAVNGFALFGLAVPTFWLALLLLIVFGVDLRWLPASGYTSPGTSIGDNLRHLVLPAASLFIYEVAILTRFVRAKVIEQLGEEYVRTAIAKGMAPRRILTRHVMRNSLGPLVTVSALEFGTLFGAIVVVEEIFRWPGLGLLTIDAITDRDFPVIEGVVLTVAAIVVLANLVADGTNMMLNPRVRDTVGRRT
ncbi:MAG: peptide/nickel transport system permease protein [Solirubrobacteraceae bacterium]|nr:peptide/nickel transport system permease protein [Solirubrobacteraceae bacterium]